MKWTATQSMKYPRKNFAVALVDKESKIIVIGGGMDESNKSIEIYDPIVNLWSARGKL